MTEEEVLVARDLAEKKSRRMRRAELRALEKRGVVRPEENLTQSEVILNGLGKDARGTTSSRQLRPRPARVSIAKVRTVPGRDSFDGVEPTEAVRQMELARKCGFNRVIVAPSTIG